MAPSDPGELKSRAPSEAAKYGCFIGTNQTSGVTRDQVSVKSDSGGLGIAVRLRRLLLRLSAPKMWEENLASLLIGRLASPVVRVDFKGLQRACATTTTTGSPEAVLVARYKTRSCVAVQTMLDALCSAASSADEESSRMGSITRTAFHTFHALVSRALLNRVDEHTSTVMADCEWALGGGTDRMDFEAFRDWMFDVLEAWSAHGESAIVTLAEEILEGIIVPQQRAGHATIELRKAEDVEWSGLLRFRDRTGAPPVGLNWPQAKRLVEAAITWRAWEPPAREQLADLANGRWAPPSVAPSPRLPPSALASDAAATADAMWMPVGATVVPMRVGLEQPLQPSTFHVRVSAAHRRNASLSRNGPYQYDPPSSARTDMLPSMPASGVPSPGPSPRGGRAGDFSAQEWMGASGASEPAHRIGPHSNVALVSASEWVSNSEPTGRPTGSAEMGSPRRHSSRSARQPTTDMLGLPPAVAGEREMGRPPARVSNGLEESMALGGAALPPMSAEATPRGVSELGAMRVAPPGQTGFSPRARRGGMNTHHHYVDALGRQPGSIAAQGAHKTGLGLASVSKEMAMERTRFAGKALYNDTIRRREDILARAAASVGHSPRSPRHHASGKAGAAPAVASALPPSAALDDSIAQVENAYAWMDKQLMGELTTIARDELSRPLPDDATNRRLRLELAQWVDRSRTRVGSLHHEHFDHDSLTPVVARKSLKEGMRMPLELVRSEVHQRYPHRRAVYDQVYDGYEMHPPPVAAPFAALPNDEATAAALPPMA